MTSIRFTNSSPPTQGQDLKDPNRRRLLKKISRAAADIPPPPTPARCLTPMGKLRLLKTRLRAYPDLDVSIDTPHAGGAGSSSTSCNPLLPVWLVMNSTRKLVVRITHA
jgi:hypothetical protein